MLSLLPVWLLCGCMSVVSPAADAPWYGGEDPRSFVPGGPLMYEQVFLPPAKFGPREAATYVVRLYGWEMERSVEVLRNGQRVFALSGMRVVLFEELDLAEPHPAYGSLPSEESFETEEEKEAALASWVIGGTGRTPNTDVTGDGVPELVIGDLNGVNHTFLSRFIFELWPRFRQLPAIGTLDREDLGLQDVDGDGVREIVTSANPMADWAVAGFERPYEDVVLKYDGECFKPAAELMRQHPWSDEVIERWASVIRADKHWVPDRPHGPAALWQRMLGLCFEGNAAQAWKLLELAWPGDAASRDAYRASFEQALGEDPFGAELLRLSRSSMAARIRPPDARRVFPNPAQQPGEPSERVVEIRGPRAGVAREKISVLENGKRVLEINGTNFRMLSNLGAASGGVGTDLDGDGQDELVVTSVAEHRGQEAGMLQVYRVWPKFERIAEVPWQPDWRDVFVNLDDDRDIEIRVRERVHDTWAFCCHMVDPVAPTVVLKLQDGMFKPCRSLMMKPAPDPDVLQGTAMRIQSEFGRDEAVAEAALWSEMLSLTYTGHVDSAVALFGDAWPEDRPGKEEALETFRERLDRSRFGPAVLEFAQPEHSDVED